MPIRLFPIYNVDKPVGPRKPNLTEDVRLVQNLFIELSRFYANEWVRNISPAQRNLAPTGLFDDTLESWIKTYQDWLVAKFGGVRNFMSDGVIDPMPMHHIDADTNFQSGRISTLAMMCNQLWRLDRGTYMRIGDQYNIPWVPDHFDS